MPNEPKPYPHLDEPPSLGDLNQSTAFILAELHLQNELLYSASNKGAKNNPVPDQETLTSLVSLFRRVLDDPANRDNSFGFPLREYIREDGTHDGMTLLENLREEFQHRRAT
jgi:hypothetical protein